jgi:hypothetical protein
MPPLDAFLGRVENRTLYVLEIEKEMKGEEMRNRL